MKPNQYVIAKTKEANAKPYLARIKTINDNGDIEAVLEKDIHFKQQAVTLTKKDIKVNLGINPLPGKAYGLDLDNLFKKTIEHDFWGNIHFFVELEKDVMKMLRTSLDKTAERITKLKLEPFVKLIETEIRSKKGKYAGMYTHSKDDAKPHRIWYAPEHSLAASNPKEYMEYIVYHEFGHAVRYNGVTRNKLRNKWLRLYQKTIAPVKIEKDVLKAMLKEMSEYDENEESFRHVFKTVNEDQNPRTSKAILQWLKQTHRIGTHDLEVMWRASATKDLENYWPDHMIDTHDLKPAVSDYATKNVEELFAESFAMYCQKKKLPASIEELLETSLSTAKAEIGT
jgi:hypothetical protein